MLSVFLLWLSFCGGGVGVERLLGGGGGGKKGGFSRGRPEGAIAVGGIRLDERDTGKERKG